MKKEFIERVITDQTVDTRKYRYRVIAEGKYATIVRLPIKMLDTVYAYRQWEIVKVLYE